MAALDDETIESYRNITRTRRNYINTLIAYDDLQFILSFKGRAVEDFVRALPIIIEVEYERYIKISFTQVTLDAMIEKAEAIQVLKNEIISYCQSNVIAIGVFEDNVSFKTLLGNAHEFADKTTALEQFPETLLTSIRKIFNEKFNERLQNWFLTDDNNDIGKLTNAQIRQRLQAAPIFASVAINITEMRIQQNKELVQTRERLIKSYSELGLLSKLRFKTVTLEACKREFVASNWNPVVVESITEATLNRIKAEHNRTMPTSFLPFYQLHPIDWASIRVNLVATLIIIKEYSKISVDIEASITALIKDLSVESGDPANNLIRLYNIYQELNVYEKMALQGAFNMPIASSELGEPTFRFIFKAGFDPKLFGPALLTVLKEIPRPATTFSLWFSRYRPWYDEIQRGLEKLIDDQDKITDQQFGCLLANFLSNCYHQLLTNRSLYSLVFLNTFLIEQSTPLREGCYQFIKDTTDETILLHLLDELVNLIETMQKSKISRGWFAAPPIQLHAQTLVELQGLSTSPFERIKFSEILAS